MTRSNLDLTLDVGHDVLRVELNRWKRPVFHVQHLSPKHGHKCNWSGQQRTICVLCSYRIRSTSDFSVFLQTQDRGPVKGAKGSHTPPKNMTYPKFCHPDTPLHKTLTNIDIQVHFRVLKANQHVTISTTGALLLEGNCLPCHCNHHFTHSYCADHGKCKYHVFVASDRSFPDVTKRRLNSE